MKLVCSVCDRSGIDRNLLCADINCPLEKHFILGSGQIIGDIKIVQLRQMTKTHAFYDGVRHDKSVLLKVAHQDKGAKTRLQDESRYLVGYALKRLKRKNSRLSFLVSKKDPFIGIPNLLPAYPNVKVSDFPHGQAQVNGNDVVFSVWESVDGIPLEQYLTAVPEPWFDNVAYVIQRLALILELINKGNLVHGKLTPDAIWISEDKKGILRPILMDFGLLRSNQLLSRGDLIWLHEFSNIAYMASEIASSTDDKIEDYIPSNPQAIDVYGLGLLLYEMLAGHPKYDYQLQSRAQIARAIRKEDVNPLIREDIANTNRKTLLDLANASTNKEPSSRSPSSIGSFIANLKQIIGEIPPEKPRNTIVQQIWRAGLIVGILVGVYLVLGVVLGQ